MSERLGQPFMPWQRLVADVAFEIDPETGILCYREVIVTVPRQNGKTTLFLAVETERSLLWDAPQSIVYTAQTGADARDKLLNDQVPILEKHVGKHIKRVYRARGEEAVFWANGSKITLSASSESSGHGATVDLGVLDEVWADGDNRREQAIVPMTNTRPQAQILVCSTMGDETSTYWNRKVRLGREAVERGDDRGIAYFEWSIPRDADIESPAVWAEFFPAYGLTIGEPAILHAFRTMKESEFRRAYGNQSTKLEQDRVIPEALWVPVLNADAQVRRETASPRFGFDVLPDRSWGAVCSSDGRTIELIEHRPGTGWLVPRVRDLCTNWGGTAVVDGGGPAASIADELEREGVRVDRLTNAQYVSACSRFYDKVVDGTVEIRQHESLDAAVEGLAKRVTGDRFVWSRQGSKADITPVVAATLAFAETGSSGTPGLWIVGGSRKEREERKHEEN